MKKSTFLSLSLLMVELIISPISFADSSAFRSDAPYGEFSQMHEVLSSDQLARLSFIASGLRDSQLEPYILKLNAIIKDSEKMINPSMTKDEKAEALLLFLHDNIFIRYNLTQTSLHTLIDKGTYNCVSSAILYMILTRYHGIFVQGIHAGDHAFCFIPGPGGEGVDVETTNEWGYNPGMKKEFQNSFTSRTGYVYVPPGKYKDRMIQNDRDMVGLILQNRIVALQKKNKHREALTIAADRLALTSSDLARQDYLNSLQNAAAQKNNQKDYAGGIELINKAALKDDDFPDFLKTTRSQLIYNACADAVAKNDLAAANQILNKYSRSLLADDRQVLETLLISKDFELRVKSTFSRTLIDEIAKAVNTGLISSTRAASLAAYHYSLHSEVLTKEGRNKEAYLFMVKAPQWVQKDREYKRLIRIIRDNTAIEYHNAIVALLNKNKHNEAVLLLEEGLELIPRNPLLLQDKRKLDP